MTSKFIDAGEHQGFCVEILGFVLEPNVVSVKGLGMGQGLSGTNGVFLESTEELLFFGERLCVFVKGAAVLLREFPIAKKVGLPFVGCAGGKDRTIGGFDRNLDFDFKIPLSTTSQKKIARRILPIFF